MVINISCCLRSLFYKYILDSEELLKAIKSEEKYTFQKNVQQLFICL
jgi:hypothetical protein